MKSEVIERRSLWLSWLELPWDQVRNDLVALMQANGMSQEDLAYELRRAGHVVSKSSIHNWLSHKVQRSPSLDALQALVEVFARVSMGDWAKGREASSPLLADLLTAS
jgi:transcriptional regulator with XRE-family HTH domain